MLMRAAAIVRDSVREIDVAARYGGEEFAVLLPDTSRLGAFVVAERIRRRIEERFARARTPVTISGGIAVFPDDAGRRPTSSCRRTRGSTGRRPRARTASCSPRASAAGSGGCRRRSASPSTTEATLAAASVKNLSEGGLLVSLRETVAVGSAVSLTIERTDATPVGLRGEVVRVERVPGEAEPAFDVGVRFLDPSEAESLQSSRGRFPAAPEGYLST